MDSTLANNLMALAERLNASDDPGNDVSKEEMSEMRRTFFAAAQEAKQDGENPALVRALNVAGMEALEYFSTMEELQPPRTPTEAAENLMDALKARGYVSDD
jgi:hypothetical protein